MSNENTFGRKLAGVGIAVFCFGYFASYVPYSMMTKMITRGLFQGMDGVGFTGFEIQPMAMVMCFVAMLTFVTAMGWWKYATQWKLFGVSLPRPRWFTFLSGLCTSGQIITTTLAYTFGGISIVFAMLLMRGGVLLMAPVLDMVVKKRKRKIYWPSWVAAGLSFGALIAAFSGKAGTAMTTVCAIDIGIYLAGYFFRLFFMSSYAKSNDTNEKLRFFAEEQVIAVPFLLLVLFVVGLFGMNDGRATVPGQIWYGFVGLPLTGYLLHTLLIGFFSQGTGIFGTLIYLDKRENTFTVPANRSSSIVAGVIATYALAIFFGQKYPSTHQLIGVALILAAIVFLAYRSIVEKKQKAAAAIPVKTVEPEPRPAPRATLELATETE